MLAIIADSPVDPILCNTPVVILNDRAACGLLVTGITPRTDVVRLGVIMAAVCTSRECGHH